MFIFPHGTFYSVTYRDNNIQIVEFGLVFLAVGGSSQGFLDN